MTDWAMDVTAPPVDGRDAPAFVEAIVTARPGYVPEWVPGDRGPGAALVQIAAHHLQAIVRRLDQAPDKNKMAFLDLLGVRLVPAQPARAPVVFTMSDTGTDTRVPAGTRLAAAPPPGGTTQISYETERSTGLAVARLREAVSLVPGRDQYIDHSVAVANGDPFRPFEQLMLKDTPHHLYIAHSALLNLAGASSVTMTFELTNPSSEYLDLRWEYWDGKVWRPFKHMDPACSDEDAVQLDSSNGLRSSGSYILETDCAETTPTSINGVGSYWVRARLAETLPPDPARLLPEVDRIRVNTTLDRAYSVIWRTSIKPATTLYGEYEGRQRAPSEPSVTVRVVDAAGVGLAGVLVSCPDLDETKPTPPNGTVTFNFRTGAGTTPIIVRLGGLTEQEDEDAFEQQEIVTPTPNGLVLTFSLDMLAIDHASADGAEVDLTKPFFPFGLQPQPGAAFYFSSTEAFSRPGAKLRLYVQPAATPQDLLGKVGILETNPVGELPIVAPTSTKPLPHTVSWEYWNGQSWLSLLTHLVDDSTSPNDFTSPGLVELTVPADMAPSTVDDKEGWWMRARLAGGGYGFTNTISFFTGKDQNTFTYHVSQPPSLADFRLGFTWQDGPVAPEHVVAYNDFAYVDHTEEAVWPGATFQPFTPVADPTPALYLGFDAKLPVDDLGVFFDVDEHADDGWRPTLAWEYWDGFGWPRLQVDDESENLRVAGIASFIGPADAQELARFDQPRYWLRARLSEDGPPGSTTIRSVLPNAVWVVQQQTIVNAPLGAGTGQPGQSVIFTQIPVLVGQEIEVRELAGRRAEVEWRLVVFELFGQAPRVLQELETLVAAEGPQTEVRYGPLRLVRDRSKTVIEVWVRWEEQPNVFLSGASDRHYAIDRARGLLFFTGRPPGAGAAVRAARYQSGGGRAGNVPARAINQVLAPVGGVEAVFNPVAAGGGTDTETSTMVLRRGPRTLRHRGRAVGVDDYEALAHEASPSVAVARAIPGRGPGGRTTPGWVTLVIVPDEPDARPYPSYGLRQRVLRFISERAPADLVAAGQLVVVGPEYQAVDVAATIVPRDPAEAGAVEQAVRRSISDFLHPLRGGPAKRGWKPGAPVFLSDMASVVEMVDGVDHARELALLVGGVAQGASLDMADDRVAVAGSIRLKLVEA